MSQSVNFAPGAVSLRVKKPAQMIDFYRDAIGLSEIDSDAESTTLGVDHLPLVRLVSGAKQFPPQRSTGLFHLAILLPSRQDLAHWLQHFISKNKRLDGAGDHLVSEALYLSDPEGNGIEMYSDRPRDSWTFDENGVQMATLPVDIAGLLADTPETPFTGLPTGTTMGHIHLKANHLEKAIEFYRDLLGFDLMSRFPGAGFLSKNGYHHHIGVNIWQSRNGEIPPEDATGLAAASFVFGDRSAISKIAENLGSTGYPHENRDNQLIVTDPAGNTLHLM